MNWQSSAVKTIERLFPTLIVQDELHITGRDLYILKFGDKHYQIRRDTLNDLPTIVQKRLIEHNYWWRTPDGLMTLPDHIIEAAEKVAYLIALMEIIQNKPQNWFVLNPPNIINYFNL